jgi:chemotaxis protein MotB
LLNIMQGPEMYESQNAEFNDEPVLTRRPPYAIWVAGLLVLAAAGYGVHRGLKENRRLSAELEKAKQSERALQELQGRASKLEKEKAALLAERDALQTNVQAKETALAALKEAQSKIQEKMKEEIAKGDIALTQSGGKLRVDMVDKILFDSGDAHISRRGEGVLSRVGGVLANMADRQIQVSGHTDDQPITRKLKTKFPTNWELSSARALNVVRFLQEHAHVPPGRLAATGHGEHQPIASNKGADGRARNRRIEILLTPTLAPEPVSKDKLEAQPVAPRRGRVAARR